MAEAKFKIVEEAPGLRPAPAFAVSTFARPPLSMPTRGRIFVVDIIDMLFILALAACFVLCFGEEEERDTERQRASLDPAGDPRWETLLSIQRARLLLLMLRRRGDQLDGLVDGTAYQLVSNVRQHNRTCRSCAV